MGTVFREHEAARWLLVRAVALRRHLSSGRQVRLDFGVDVWTDGPKRLGQASDGLLEKAAADWGLAAALLYSGDTTYGPLYDHWISAGEVAYILTQAERQQAERQKGQEPGSVPYESSREVRSILRHAVGHITFLYDLRG